MIATVGALRGWCATKLAAPHHQCVFEQSALFEISQQSGDRLVDFERVFLMARLEVAVLVPLNVGVAVDECHYTRSVAGAKLDRCAGSVLILSCRLPKFRKLRKSGSGQHTNRTLPLH